MAKVVIGPSLQNLFALLNKILEYTFISRFWGGYQDTQIQIITSLFAVVSVAWVFFSHHAVTAKIRTKIFGNLTSSVIVFY